MWKLKYAATAARLLVCGRIRFATFRMAPREWPVAVARKRGYYVLDPEFPG